MSNLPTEIITNILSRLPLKSLSRFRCVSKPWCSLIKDPYFIKLHLHLHPAVPHIMVRYSKSDLFSVKPNSDSTFYEAKRIDYPYKTPLFGLEILGSCNGLLFIKPDQNISCIWNPTTQEFVTLPETPIDTQAEDENRLIVRGINYGFGYDDFSQDYKVVKIVSFYNGKSQVKAYTMGSNSWTRVEEDVPSHCYLYYEGVPGVLLNGCLHWVAGLKQKTVDISKIIISFDLADQSFKVVPLPDYEQHSFCMYVGVFRGCLCLLNYFHAPIRLELRVMMDYGVKESWTMLYSFSDAPTITSFQYFNPSCKFLLENKDIVFCDRTLPRKGSAPQMQVKEVDILLKILNVGNCGPSKWSESETYVESLVSLNTSTYVWEKQPKRRRKNNMPEES